MAIDIEADTSYVETAADPRLLLTKQFTVMGWFRPTDVAGASYRSLWSIGTTTTDRIFCTLEGSTGKCFICVHDSTLSKYRFSFAGTFVPKANEWQHFAAVIDMSAATQN